MRLNHRNRPMKTIAPERSTHIQNEETMLLLSQVLSISDSLHHYEEWFLGDANVLRHIPGQLQ